MGASFFERSRDPRQRLSAVDEDLQRIALPHGSGLGPTAGVRIERVVPADPPQAPLMMSAHLDGKTITRPLLHGSPAAAGQRQRS